ncbi:hypothetical protein RclHR1_05590025 [Rhizophagus clarus]|uniref:Uncharacterized protein n=1 Tax=Rhizophagus clarus TaxID=94130 RepID=A0A2Z6S565_9GLOM|nr:hypothetical protein RclHR1_05590025 [Rhizophagus clarus]
MNSFLQICESNFHRRKIFYFHHKERLFANQPSLKNHSNVFYDQSYPPITALKSISSDRFHDIIVDFISGLIKRNSSTIFSSIITMNPLAIDEFLSTYKEQMIPMDKLSRNIYSNDYFPTIAQFLATFLNLFLLDDENQEIFLIDSKICRVLEYTRSLDDVDELLATPSRNITPIPVTLLTKSQKRSTKKKTCKEKQKLQL